MKHLLPAIVAFLVLGACQATEPVEGVPGNAEDTAPYAGIGPDETVRFTGTEPFWGGTVSGAALTYETPDNPEGEPVAVERFAGRGGLSWSGRLRDQRFVLAVTPGECSDGMSDRIFPFVATLEVEGGQRSGCAWTAQMPFTGPGNP